MLVAKWRSNKILSSLIINRLKCDSQRKMEESEPELSEELDSDNESSWATGVPGPTHRTEPCSLGHGTLNLPELLLENVGFILVGPFIYDRLKETFL